MAFSWRACSAASHRPGAFACLLLFARQFAAMTDPNLTHKQLFKVLLGVAWIDGKIQPEERQYLHAVAREQGLLGDRDIAPLLSEARPIQPSECYRWLQDYLGQQPDREVYAALVEQLSALIYSDGEVDAQEAKLLAELQALDPSQQSPQSAVDKAIATIQRLYRQAVGL